MSDNNYVGLECSCVKDSDAEFASSSCIDAVMTINAEMGTALCATSELRSPPSANSCTGTVSAVAGDGPLYTVSIDLSDCNCLDNTWQAEIEGINGYGDLETYYYTIQELTDCGDGDGFFPAEGDVCELTLLYDSSTDGFDRPIEVDDVITLNGACDATNPLISIAVDVDARLFALSNIKSTLSAFFDIGEGLDLTANTEIDDGITVDYAISQSLTAEGNIELYDTDKIAGRFGDFYCQEKLYPRLDLPVDSGFGSFIGIWNQEDDLYQFINEGVYEGILKDRGDSIVISDDENSFIHPNTVNTEGLFQYKCEVTDLNVRPDESAFRIRVAAPLQNYESSLAPLYTLYNIKLLDPSGNLVVQYDDIPIRGDSPPGISKFSTYSSLPKINRMDDYDWTRRDQPHMQEVEGYQVTFSVRAVALDDPFDPGFDAGFEENYILPEILTDGSGNNYLALDGAPLSTQEVRFINPTDGFKVTAFEICNSGGFGPRREDLLSCYVEVAPTGRRLERTIRADIVATTGYDTTINPYIQSVWQSESNTANPFDYTNEDDCGAIKLAEAIREDDDRKFIVMTDQTGGGIADSGKLTARFSQCTSNVDQITGGAFNFEFDQSSNKRWWSPSGAFNTENRTVDIARADSAYYKVDSLVLRVLAKKEAGTRDYVLDVVGYSEDKLLNNTSPSGGFLQNPSGICLNNVVIGSVGAHPIISGFYQESDGPLDGQALSESEKYFEASGNSGGDHYSLAQYPVINSTEFEWYEIPLEVVDDNVRLGLSQDYSLSPFFEKIWLDIFPIPSGGAIAYAELAIRYAPSNALNFYTQGGEKLGKTQDGRSEASLFPTSRGSVDDYLNTGSGYQPLSQIENLPHTFDSPETLKTNYARRWRGVNGVVRGPYDPDMFGFGFENPTIDYPFLSGYYKFDNITDGYVQSSDLGPTGIPSGLGTSSGLLVGDPEIYQNVGWRFASGTLFEDHLPGFSGNYTSTDWTALSNGGTTFVGNPMYGKIADAFDRVVRISGEAGQQQIDFGTIDTVSGFAVFLRFTPDSNVSGVGYDLFESGVLASQWDTPSDMGWALGYEGGFLTAWMKDDGGNVISIQDTANYYDYSYPLSVLLTYNDNYSKRLKLYTDSEDAAGMWDTLRDVSTEIERPSNNAPLVLGYSAGSGVGMNMLVSEFGISAYSSGVDTLYGSGTNIVESNADWTYKQVTAEKFLENFRAKYFNPSEPADKDRYKLWDRVNEDTYNDWELGAFQYCPFGPAFSQWQVRPNKEHIVFDIAHHGSGYSQNNDLSMLSTVDSGVAYHTQMENDFLRFHLSDVPDSFYAVNRRITKNVPCGYKFSERALVVESVVNHTTGLGIKWSGCEDVVPSGPRMIVSLYTKNQEPYWTSDQPNWGLVNRKIHYLMPSSCIQRFDTTFTFDDLCDETEAWAIFPDEPKIKDFDERYFTDDVNQMFVQYDLVYPSGPAFESRFELHSSHVRMADANICDIDVSGNMNLVTSGAFPADAQINLNIGGFPRDESGVLPLQIQTPLPYSVFDTPGGSGFTLNVSGAFNQENSMNLFASPSPSAVDTFTLNVDGFLPPSASGSLNFALPKTIAHFDSSNDNRPDTTGSGIGNFFGMPITLVNTQVSISPSGPMLTLNTFASPADAAGIRDTLPLLLYNNIIRTETGSDSGVINLMMRGRENVDKTTISANMPLYINAPNILDLDMPLYVHSPRELAIDSGTMSLVTANYNSNFGSAYGLWFNNSYGTGIELEDNYNAYVPVDNEIRGVDLVAYGSCTGDSPSKAIDLALTTDCTVWRDETCNDGGIFRAKDTYFNPDAVNIEGGIGYSGEYYGIRKYTQLIPSVAYTATITIKTGNTDPIPVPRTFEEWGYGMCGPDWDADGCCVEDCDQNLVFSGVKLIADDAQGVAPTANLVVDSEFLLASGRNVGDKYGTKVSVKGDLMAVAAPYITIPDIDAVGGGPIDASGAGAVFLYRRNTDVAGKSAAWDLVEPLTLPVGYRKDYIQRTAERLLTFGPYSISGNKWQIGQEGREFGSSLDMAVSGDKETIVVGAPRAKWVRDFDDIDTSGIPTAGIVFADLFNYNIDELQSVAATASRFNILWKYFSAPWNPGPSEYYAEINPKMLVFQLTYSEKDYPVVPTDYNSWFTHRYIPRLDDLDLLKEIGSGELGGAGSITDWINAAKPIVSNLQLSGVLDGFFDAFPKGQTTFYSGIPCIVGMFKEQTGSTAGALQYADEDGNIVNIYDRFTDFYHEYSSNSGVYDPTTNLAQSGHLNTIVGKSENWATTATELMFDTFDSGRLSNTFTNSTLNRDFITSGVGQIWGDTHAGILQEFQLPPASGGRVYIFEKERDNFNCIQVIASPNDASDFIDNNEGLFGGTYSKTYNDRFGHSVGISANSEIVSIGSPWNPECCTIWERDESENQKVYSAVKDWCEQNSKTSAVDHHNAIVQLSGVDAANISTYDFLSASERFAFRNDAIYWGSFASLPQPYRQNYSYSYSDIQYVGTRKFLPEAFAGTSRLGWSTSVNDDGTTVAFGAPTDSFNEFEDANVWGDDLKRWASHVNAGAVRMFESRPFYPHSGVVEFGRFGNLDRSTHQEEREAGFYDQMNLFFADGADGTAEYKEKYWRRTDFSEIELPRDAGLAFIMTPELDAASDEIIQNIKDWLALGDRNLVLVGNDPVWEDNGLYKDSNEIINKILDKLGSRMRIYPAKDISYSMQGCVNQDDINDNKYNITASKVPAGSVGVTLEQGNYYAKGVGDIRLFLERDGLENYYEEMNCPEGATCDPDAEPPVVNIRCEFPLGHEQDLRAEWTEQCKVQTPNYCKIVSYKRNVPQLFNNFEVVCDDPPLSLFDKPGQEPVPVLTTAEHLPPSSWYRPATSGLFCDEKIITEWRIQQTGSESKRFAENNLDEIAFNIEEDVDSSPSGIFNQFGFNKEMFDPDKKNGRDGLFQAVGSDYYPESEERTETYEIYPDSILALVESGRFDDGAWNNSRVYIMASQWSETDSSRGIDSPTLNDDKNTEFYINMVRKNCTDAPRGIQINGFTGRTSLENAWNLKDESEESNHSLGDKLNVEFALNGGGFEENKELDDLNNLVDFCWIAYPSGKPSDQDINKIKQWMNLGEKKLIITYNAANADRSQEIADNVDYLCSGLNVESRPFFLPKKGEYHTTGPIIESWDSRGPKQLVNTATDAVSGCDNGYTFTIPNYQEATSLSGVEFSPNDINAGGSDNDDLRNYIPISGGGDYELILYWDQPITETRTIYPTNRYKIDGDAWMTFPAASGSGYRLFVNWVSEATSEKFAICGSLSGATLAPSDEDDDAPYNSDLQEDSGFTCGKTLTLSKTTTFSPSQYVVDIKAQGDEVGLQFDTSLWKSVIPEDELIDGILPTTPRLLSVSGCPLPIITETIINTTSGEFIIDRIPINCRYEVNPAQSGEVPGVSRPVSHKSEIYCKSNPEEQCEDLGQTLIQDGPVVVAEEFESFSAFNAGRRRSKIIVVADSTMLQGQCPAYRGDALGSNQDFIRSLYPESDDLAPADVFPIGDNYFIQDNGEDTSRDIEFSNNGRNWYFAQKIRAPERGSAGKYSSLSGDAVANITTPLYGAGGGGPIAHYWDDEDSYDPTTLTRPTEIPEGEREQKIEEFYDDEIIAKHGMFPRFSGDFLNINPPDFYEPLLGYEPDVLVKDFIVDAQIGGGLNDLMRINNTDYLDLDVYYSGCLGDLFGYSVDLSNNTMVVGTPFNAFVSSGTSQSGIVQWDEVVNSPDYSGVEIAQDGGAGAAFVFNKTNNGANVIQEFLPWEFTAKIKPSSVNVGMYDFSPSPIVALTNQRGAHNIQDPSYIVEFAKRSDNFGVSVSIDCDMIAIGAPNHDYETVHHHIYSGAIVPNDLNTAFQHKSFNAEFDIPTHSYYDLSFGHPLEDSGVMVLNNGAVYNYRNELVDFQKREQEWIFAEKLYAQGYNDRTQREYTPDGLGGYDLTGSGTENDRFGQSVCINRSRRGDSDYVMVVGAPRHFWPTSGDHATKELQDAGAGYTFDAMLREQIPAIPNDGGWIEAHVFGQKKDRDATDRLETRVYQNTTGDSLTYQVSGLVFSNRNGDIFLEVSGFDPSLKGFIAHRPYVEKVDLELFPPDSGGASFNLVASGAVGQRSGEMNLSMLGADQANVYNTVNLYQSAVLGNASGSMNMFTEAPSGTSGNLNLNMGSTQTPDSLDLNIRGY